MTRVKWDELDPGLYEDIVAVLLSNIYPEAAERIDGRLTDRREFWDDPQPIIQVLR